jgi:hypothetical protein
LAQAGALEVSERLAATEASALEVSERLAATEASALEVSERLVATEAGALEVSERLAATEAGALEVSERLAATEAGALEVSERLRARDAELSAAGRTADDAAAAAATRLAELTNDLEHAKLGASAATARAEVRIPVLGSKCLHYRVYDARLKVQGAGCRV